MRARVVRAVVRRLRRRRLRPGVNVVGYLGETSGLGERARELVATLRSAGVAVSEWPVEPAGGAAPSAELYDTTVAVVTAVQLAGVRERLPEPFEQAHRVIGYFFWELAEIPDEQRWGIGLVDEIWAPTEFVRSAYAGAATGVPVRLAPLPVAAPSSSGPVRGDDGSFVFLVSFDHRSVMERKNPLAAIRAFRLAFPGTEPAVRLVVKTIHGDEHPDDTARLREAAAGDPRVEIRDDELDAPGHFALMERADAFVSLHRSEGLGLHLAEAMWLGTPVVATRYSGNLDLMDDSCAALVGARLVPVPDGIEAYPAGASWAEPDVDDAAAVMRRLVDDAEWRAGLAAAGRQRVESQPTRADAGAALAALVRAGRAGPGASGTPSR